MIIIKNHEITDEVTRSLISIMDKDISPKIAFQLLSFSDKLDSIIVLKNKIHGKILEKYGEPAEGNTFNIPNENIEDYNTDMNELMSIEHKFDISKINLSDIEPTEKLKVSDLINLKFLIHMDDIELESSESDVIEKYI